jgi:IS5 family transposase
MKVHAGVDKDSGLIHSVAVTAANVHDLTPACELLHGDEEMVYGDAGYQGIAKRPEMAGKTTEFRPIMALAMTLLQTGSRQSILARVGIFISNGGKTYNAALEWQASSLERS